MTGPCAGKIRLEGEVEMPGRKLDASIYIHLKGFSRACVTHLDVEHPQLQVLPPKRGGFFLVRGIEGGIELGALRKKLNGTFPLIIRCNYLNEVLEVGRGSHAWVGGKVGGFYIGFRKLEIAKLEKLAQRLAE
jgi:hypothetical protein